MKEIVLDTETTGISVKEGHRIVEIGVSEKAFKVHGYSDEFLSKQKKFNEVVEDFLDFIKGKKLIIHNAEFDLGHLNHELGILGKNKISN